MPSRKDANLENVLGVRAELLALLSGMDYCLDWKANPSEWSVRQVVYHILDTPSGGIPKILGGMLSGELKEFEIVADLDNMTPARQGNDLEDVRQDISDYFQAMQEALESATETGFTETGFDEKSALVHLTSRGVHEQRTAQEVLERAFNGHWSGHLAQIRELRDALGM